jgi:hypothetical protein
MRGGFQGLTDDRYEIQSVSVANTGRQSENMGFLNFGSSTHRHLDKGTLGTIRIQWELHNSLAPGYTMS